MVVKGDTEMITSINFIIAVILLITLSVSELIGLSLSDKNE